MAGPIGVLTRRQGAQPSRTGPSPGFEGHCVPPAIPEVGSGPVVASAPCRRGLSSRNWSRGCAGPPFCQGSIPSRRRQDRRLQRNGREVVSRAADGSRTGSSSQVDPPRQGPRRHADRPVGTGSCSGVPVRHHADPADDPRAGQTPNRVGTAIPAAPARTSGGDEDDLRPLRSTGSGRSCRHDMGRRGAWFVRAHGIPRLRRDTDDINRRFPPFRCRDAACGILEPDSVSGHPLAGMNSDVPARNSCGRAVSRRNGRSMVDSGPERCLIPRTPGDG